MLWGTGGAVKAADLTKRKCSHETHINTMNTSTSKQTIRVSFIGEADSINQITALATERGTNTSAIIREAINLYLNNASKGEQ